MLFSEKFLPSCLKNMRLSFLEIVLIIIFTVYIISPVESPIAVSNFVGSPLGLIAIFVVTAFLFIYTNPILGILYLFVAYEMLRRSDKVATVHHNDQSYGKFLPITMPLAPTTMPNMTPMLNALKAQTSTDVVPLTHSLEEEIISSNVSIPEGDTMNYVETLFKPIVGNIHNASYA